MDQQIKDKLEQNGFDIEGAMKRFLNNEALSSALINFSKIKAMRNLNLHYQQKIAKELFTLHIQ